MNKAVSLFASAALVASAALAQHAPDLNQGHVPDNHKMPTRLQANNRAGGAGGAGQLVNHGGPVMANAKVVLIFWGSSFGTASAPSNYAKAMQKFRDSQGGLVKHTNMLAQYNAPQSNLIGQLDVFDSSNPPSTNVTDAMVQGEVKKWFTGTNAKFDTIYEVFIPNGYFSSDGSSGSCGATGGVSLAYCAYHSNYAVSGGNVKYSIEPWPSCSGCSASGFTTENNAQHFMVHETREAMTDALGTAWWDRAGYEADDKCAWTGLFTEFDSATGLTFGYQPEYSNATRGCVK
jgi:hypothetical protein